MKKSDNMRLRLFREKLESQQIGIYFGAIVAAAVAALLVPGTAVLEAGITPALAVMLFATFLQVPLAELRRVFTQARFIAALLTANFVIVPLLVAGLAQFLPPDPMIRLGVLLVLLAPCIDYVVTFSHIGKADARLLLAATPVLLVLQMILLPLFLGLLLGSAAGGIIQIGPFIHAFVWLIAVPLLLAALVQTWVARNPAGMRTCAALSLLPVPATATVLFVVIASMLPQLGPASAAALRAVPIYVVFAILAPPAGWLTARMFRLNAPAGRAVAFSAGTRNSLVVLPLAFAVPGSVPVLPAIIVTQTLVELVSELVYVRLIAKLGAAGSAVRGHS